MAFALEYRDSLFILSALHSGKSKVTVNLTLCFSSVGFFVRSQILHKKQVKQFKRNILPKEQ